MKRWLILVLLALPQLALAQSLPYPIQAGTVWTTAQWIAAWQSKADVNTVAGTVGANFNAAFPTSGTAIGALNGGNMVSVSADSAGNLNIDCQIGCGQLPVNASTASNQAAIQGPVTPGTAATRSVLMGGVFNSAAPTLTTGQQAALQTDANGYLKVNVVVGGGTGGTSSTFAATFPGTGTAIGAKNGTNMVNLVADASSNLQVNCAVGCSGGTFNNNADAVATSAANGQTASWMYGFNGTTWDRLRVDGSKNLDVTVNTALPAGTNLVGKAGIDQTTPGTTNAVSLAQIGATTVVTGGVAGSLAIGGPTATGAAIAANPVTTGGRAQNAERTPVTNGQVVDKAMDLTGKQIIMPYANKENFLNGSTAAITTAANTSVISAQAAGIKIYVTGFSCANTGATTSLLQFTSGSGGSVLWTTVNPAGSGTNAVISPPVATAAATALYVTTGSASSNQYCSVTGYAGT